MISSMSGHLPPFQCLPSQNFKISRWGATLTVWGRWFSRAIWQTRGFLSVPRALLISWMGGDMVTGWCWRAVIAVVGSCTCSLALRMKLVEWKKKGKRKHASMPPHRRALLLLSWPVVDVACSCHCDPLLTRLDVVVRAVYHPMVRDSRRKA